MSVRSVPGRMWRASTQEEKVDENTIYCGYICKDTKIRKREKRRRRRAGTPNTYPPKMLWCESFDKGLWCGPVCQRSPFAIRTSQSIPHNVTSSHRNSDCDIRSVIVIRMFAQSDPAASRIMWVCHDLTPLGAFKRVSRCVRRCATQKTRIQSPKDFALRSLI